jgi:hypothetical protein
MKDEVPRFEQIGTWDSCLLISAGSADDPFFALTPPHSGAVAGVAAAVHVLALLFVAAAAAARVLVLLVAAAAARACSLFAGAVVADALPACCRLAS